MDEKTVEIKDSRSSHLAVNLCWEPAELTRLYKFKKSAWKLFKGIFSSDSFQGDTDLDLSCFIYDEDGRYVTCVSGQSHQLIDPSGCVNHTGDNRDGYGNIDESISLKLSSMPAAYKQFIFLITSPQKMSFKDIKDIEVRIENRSANNLIYSKVLAQDASQYQHAHIPCGIFNHPEGWHIQEMDHYTDINQDWPVHLRKYLLTRT